MRYLSSFKPYNESKKSIESICKEYGIRNYTINGDGTIDVDGEVVLENLGLGILPIRFNKVTKAFLCNDNKLTTLEGSPKEVGRFFNCYNNKLTTLEGGPEIVGHSFNCVHNYLTSIKGGPKKVGGAFNCSHNELTSLEGGPKILGSNFYCSNNKLTSISGLPDDFYGSLELNGNPVQNVFSFIHYEYRLPRFFSVSDDLHSYLSNSKIANLLNEYDVISLDGKKVYRDNLEEVLHSLGIKIPENIQIPGYEIH